MSTNTDTKLVRVLAVCNHPGGAKALVPVLTSLIDHKVDVHLITSRGSLELFSGLEVLCETVSSKPDRSLPLRKIQFTRPDLILLGTSVPDRPDTEWLEVSFLAAAEMARVKTIAVLDHWSRYEDRFLMRGKEERHVLPDRICVMDQRAWNEMREKGFPEERLRITGNPYWDSFRGIRKTLQSTGRESLRRGLQIEDGERFLLFISQPISQIHDCSLQYTECSVFQDLLEVLQTSNELSDVTMGIRVHPREPRKQLQAILRRYGTSARWFDDTAPVFELGWASDFVVGMFSTLVTELSLLGIPVISYQPEVGPHRMTRLGDKVKVTHDTLELRKELLKQDRTRLGCDNTQVSMNATRRVMSEIEDLLVLATT